MSERLRFYFDPLCPWCYQTSRWIRRLEALGEVRVDWAVFSLELVNAGTPQAQAKGHARSVPALRTAVALRETSGNAAVGHFYAALGAAVHEGGASVDDRAVLERALEEAGAEPALLDKALADPATREAVRAEHSALIERTRSFGVPTIVLDGGAGPAIFGPVISNPPADDDAVELWRHVAWLTRYENFSELKRERTIAPDLVSFRRRSGR